MSPTSRSPRGLTLIELIVTISILALLLAAAAPSISGWIRNTQVRNTASSMLAGLNRARNEALRRNAPVRFSLVSLADSAVMDGSCALSSNGVSWVVSLRDPTSNCNKTPTQLEDPDVLKLALNDANDPIIVERHAGGSGGKHAAAAALLADGVTAGSTVTFNSFGRVADATSVRVIDVKSAAGNTDARRLRIEIAPGGSVRLCDFDVAAATDPRRCDPNIPIAFQ
jgi:type IV fimbrial biogenesis protein FimT